MNDYAVPPTEREKTRRLHADIAVWQRATIGILAVSTAVNVVQQATILRRNEIIREKSIEITELKERCDILVAIEKDAIQAYGDLLLQVEAEKEAHIAQSMAYESLSGYQYIGECTVTAYCPCRGCCGPWADGLTSTGIPAEPGIVAVDPEIIPIGSTVMIDGRRYLAADTGVTGRWVDVCLQEHQDTVAFGVQTAEVWVVSGSGKEYVKLI